MMTSLLITEGRILDPKNSRDGIYDLLIQNGFIFKISKKIKPSPDSTILPAKGMWVFPGLIDAHVHFREPGGEISETIETGSRAAASGGVTSVLAMANTQPPVDSPQKVRWAANRIKEKSLVKIYPVGAVTKNLEGEELADLEGMAQAGAHAFSDDGRCVMNSGLLRNALKKTKHLNSVLIEHCEDENISLNGVVNEGAVSKNLNCGGIPRESEAVMVARNIYLAQLTGAPIHCAHISARESVELLRIAKKKKIPVSAETCPHYFTLTEDSVGKFGSLAKMKPPLRTKEDKDAILEALRDGTIDSIATDHAPHAPRLKKKPLARSPFGITGLETSFSLVYSELILKKILNPLEAIEKMTLAPAKIFNLPGGELSIGSPADIAIFDPKKEWNVQRDRFFSKSSNSPFIGRKLRGKITVTIVNGKIVFYNGRV